MAVAAGVWLWRDRATPTPPPAQQQSTASIAVLPFADMSAEKNQEYFSDGLAEEILNKLAKIPALRVVARTSSFQFKGKTGDLRSVGETLNASTILEGSVRKQGNRVRVTAQLIKAADGFHLWSDTYDRELTDIFAVQDDIAKAVAAALQVTLLGSRERSTGGAAQERRGLQRRPAGPLLPGSRREGKPREGGGIFRAGTQARSELCRGMGGTCRCSTTDQARFGLRSAGRGVPPGAGRGGAGARPRWEPRRRSRPDRLDQDAIYDWDWAGADCLAAAGACVWSPETCSLFGGRPTSPPTSVAWTRPCGWTAAWSR